MVDGVLQGYWIIDVDDPESLPEGFSVSYTETFLDKTVGALEFNKKHALRNGSVRPELYRPMSQTLAYRVDCAQNHCARLVSSHFQRSFALKFHANS